MSAGLVIVALAGGIALAMVTGRARASIAPSSPAEDFTPQRNLTAFLRVIREAESSNNYRALVGGGNFNDFSAHPTETMDFQGVWNPRVNLPSRAAGAYQIVYNTYLSLGGGDFSPESQDRMAIELIERRGALGHVYAGRIAQAHALLRPEWEALTMQRWSPERVAQLYTQHGGTLA